MFLAIISEFQSPTAHLFKVKVNNRCARLRKTEKLRTTIQAPTFMRGDLPPPHCVKDTLPPSSSPARVAPIGPAAVITPRDRLNPETLHFQLGNFVASCTKGKQETKAIPLTWIPYCDHLTGSWGCTPLPPHSVYALIRLFLQSAAWPSSSLPPPSSFSPSPRPPPWPFWRLPPAGPAWLGSCPPVTWTPWAVQSPRGTIYRRGTLHSTGRGLFNSSREQKSAQRWSGEGDRVGLFSVSTQLRRNAASFVITYPSPRADSQTARDITTHR